MKPGSGNETTYYSTYYSVMADLESEMIWKLNPEDHNEVLVNIRAAQFPLVGYRDWKLKVNFVEEFARYGAN